MKAIAISAEMINTSAVPWNGLGISLYSTFSRIPAISTIAMKKPTPVAIAYTTVYKRSYSYVIAFNATPSTAQFVVISGKNTPSD